MAATEESSMLLRCGVSINKIEMVGNSLEFFENRNSFSDFLLYHLIAEKKETTTLSRVNLTL